MSLSLCFLCLYSKVTSFLDGYGKPDNFPVVSLKQKLYIFTYEKMHLLLQMCVHLNT